MPSLIALHKSWTLPLNATMAMMAITTSTPTRMAYSVVPARSPPAAVLRHAGERELAGKTPSSRPCQQRQSSYSCIPPYIIPPAPSSGPNMDRSNAGKMSVPVGISSLTGARSISRSTAARWAARISRLWAASVSASGAPRQALPRCDGKGLERPHIQVARGRQKLILSRPYAHTPCHAGSLKAERQRRSAIGAKTSSAASNERPAESPRRTTSIISDTSPSDTCAVPPVPSMPFNRATRHRLPSGSRNNQQHLAFADPDDLVCVRTIEPRRDKHADAHRHAATPTSAHSSTRIMRRITISATALRARPSTTAPAPAGVARPRRNQPKAAPAPRTCPPASPRPCVPTYEPAMS